MNTKKKSLWGVMLAAGVILVLAAMAPGAWATPNQSPLRQTLPTPGKIVGVVFRDNNGNAVYDAGVDTPLGGVVVTLDPGEPGEQTFISNPNGTYEFIVLAGSTHIVAALGVQRQATEGERVDIAEPVPVGGVARLPNGYKLLAPWVGLAALVGVVAVAAVVRLRRQE